MIVPMINHCDWCRDHLRQPGQLQSAAGAVAVSGVALTNVVYRLPAFQRTVEAVTEPVPVTVSVKVAAPRYLVELTRERVRG